MGEGNRDRGKEGENPINKRKSQGPGGQEQALCIDNNTLDRNENAVTF